MMPSKIRQKLCSKCRKIINEYEENYREKNREKIKKYKREHYLEKERKKSDKIKKVKELKKSLDKIPNEEVW